MFKLLAGLALCGSLAAASPLYDYVHAPNPAFNWFYTGYNISAPGWTGYVLNMTSGTWLSPADSSAYIWTHQVLVIVPDNLNPNFTKNAALYITGGSQDQAYTDITPDNEDVFSTATIAVNAGTIAATLWQVPNEPIVFSADAIPNNPRSEDAAVAFTWYTYMTNVTNLGSCDPSWIIYFPMVRAAKFAMDATAQFVNQTVPGVRLTQWIAAGASKRGWTTWLLGSVLPTAPSSYSPSLMGIAPIVMDLLNFQTGVSYMQQSLGGYTFAFKDYYDMGIPAFFGTQYSANLALQIDPLNYKSNLTMSKLIIDATGDEFFQVQDDQFWWGDLPGETLRLMIANAEHSMATGVATLLPSVCGWYYMLLTGTPRPKLDWSISTLDGSIAVNTYGSAAQQPSRATLRFVTTLDNKRRDFRLVSGNTPANPCTEGIPVNFFGSACIRPIIWVGEDIAPSALTAAGGKYIASQPLAPNGLWRAWLLELEYPAPHATNSSNVIIITTQVSVFPNTYPFPACAGAQCGALPLV